MNDLNDVAELLAECSRNLLEASRRLADREANTSGAVGGKKAKENGFVDHIDGAARIRESQEARARGDSLAAEWLTQREPNPARVVFSFGDVLEVERAAMLPLDDVKRLRLINAIQAFLDHRVNEVNV